MQIRKKFLSPLLFPFCLSARGTESCGCPSAAHAAAGPVPGHTDVRAAQIANAMAEARDTLPAFREEPAFYPDGEFAGIRALTYNGMHRGGRKTKVFAYLGIPEHASADAPVPAIVLIHGGGGHAFLEWVKMWNDRGYAAIAMDHTGYFPTGINAGRTEGDPAWKYGLHGSFSESGYENAPDNDEMRSSGGRVDHMWMYHAVGQTILAGNILRSDPRIDRQKIGVTGISWGGVIASIAIGYDDRFAFAIPIYGSGYLEEAKSWMKDRFAEEDTRKLWSAANHFPEVRTPVLWLCWNDDNCFSVNSNSKSYLDTVRNNPATRLSVIDRMFHSHGCGWKPPESMLFADSIVKGTGRLTGFSAFPEAGDVACELTTDPSAVDIRARVCYITERMTYSIHEKYGYTSTFMDQVWKSAELHVSGNRISGILPDEAAGYYVEITTGLYGRQTVTCSPYIER